MKDKEEFRFSKTLDNGSIIEFKRDFDKGIPIHTLLVFFDDELFDDETSRKNFHIMVERLAGINIPESIFESISLDGKYRILASTQNDSGRSIYNFLKNVNKAYRNSGNNPNYLTDMLNRVREYVDTGSISYKGDLLDQELEYLESEKSKYGNVVKIDFRTGRVIKE
jgi:hypothetical protein